MKGYIVGLFIIILNIIDSLITHYLIFNIGVTESNFINEYMICIFIQFWWVPKMVITLVCATLICMYWKKTLFARRGAIIVLTVYIGVFIWHMYGLYQLYIIGAI